MKAPPGWDIPIEIRARLGDRSGRQRVIDAAGHIVMVLHRVPQPKTHDREGVFFWRTPAGEWHSSSRGQPLGQLKKLIEDYQQAVDELGVLHDGANSAHAKFKVLERIGPLNRAGRNLADTLLHARDAIDDAERRRDVQVYCDLATDVARACELLQMDAKHALDFYIAQQGEIQAAHSRQLERAGHRLNSVAAIFLPLTAVASVFGMNLRSGLEGLPPWMFWLGLVGSIVSGLTVSEILVNVKLRKVRQPAEQ